MCNQLITLSEAQLKHLIKKSVDNYHNENYDYTIKDLNTSNENKISFKMEIRCKESVVE